VRILNWPCDRATRLRGPPIARFAPLVPPALASVINLDNLHTFPKNQLTKRAVSLPSGRAQEIKRSLGHALGWAELAAR